MNISRGKINGALKLVIYGPEGIGKSTFASQFPDPLFIDTEGSTKHLDVARTPKPTSWYMLTDQIRYIKDNPGICATLIIDTADWAEMLCIKHICDSAKPPKSGIEDFGYGKGYVYLAEEFGRLLNLLEELVESGVYVVLTAHAKMRKFELPDEIGSYDRWEMKLGKQTAPLVKEWADMVLFANYKTYVINVDNQGVDKGKNKAQGGKRVMYTSHHSCWDAKNRHGLPEELPFEYSSIGHCIILPDRAPALQQPVRQPEPVKQNPLKQEPAEKSASEETSATLQTSPTPQTEPIPQPTLSPQLPHTSKDEQLQLGIPQALADLMTENNVTELEIRKAVAFRKYYTLDTPINKYIPDFINGALIAGWKSVYEIIKKIREDESMPFEGGR